MIQNEAAGQHEFQNTANAIKHGAQAGDERGRRG
jgi:hypothetical protein